MQGQVQDQVKDKLVAPNILADFENKGKEAGEEYVNSVLDKLPPVPTREPGQALSSADEELEQRLIKLKDTGDKKALTEGGGNSKAKIHKRIKHITRRLKNTIQSFMNYGPRHNEYKKNIKTRKHRR